MTTTTTAKLVTTRKPHRCWGCWHMFPAGNEMTHLTTFAPEGIGHDYTCQHCQGWIDANTDNWDQADWESMLPGEIGYWKDGQWFPRMEPLGHDPAEEEERSEDLHQTFMGIDPEENTAGYLVIEESEGNDTTQAN